jgi:hypothetical protein
VYEVHLLEAIPVHRAIGVALITASVHALCAFVCRIPTVSRRASAAPLSVNLPDQVGDQHHIRAVLSRTVRTASLESAVPVLPMRRAAEMLEAQNHLRVLFLPRREQRIGVVLPSATPRSNATPGSRTLCLPSMRGECRGRRFRCTALLTSTPSCTGAAAPPPPSLGTFERCYCRTTPSATQCYGPSDKPPRCRRDTWTGQGWSASCCLGLGQGRQQHRRKDGDNHQQLDQGKSTLFVLFYAHSSIRFVNPKLTTCPSAAQPTDRPLWFNNWASNSPPQLKLTGRH